jgi:hypothetical protein
MTFNLFPFIYSSESPLKKSNYIVGDDTLRITFRMIDLVPSNDTNTNIVFGYIFNTYFLDPSES